MKNYKFILDAQIKQENGKYKDLKANSTHELPELIGDKFVKRGAAECLGVVNNQPLFKPQTNTIGTSKKNESRKASK